jgi:hypothetical protein
MTEREAYEAILTELRKVKAPHIHLEDFNYFINKGIQEFVNEEYARFETVQQTSDALNSITSFVNFRFNYTNPNIPTVTITGNSVLPQNNIPFITGNRYNSKFVQVNFPENYFHLLNCVTDVKTLFNYKCYSSGYIHSFGTKKLNADSASDILTNAWLKPTYDRTFYKLLDHANVVVNSNETQSLNVILSPDIQIYFGDSNKFVVDNIYSEYLRKPKKVNLTVAQIDSINDTSALLDFTDYICNEIIKRVVRLLLENSKDPRLQI